jgi:LuxR family maltose regulon positive regulatory protein
LEEIGTDLYLSRETVRSHAQAIYLKLGVHSRSEAVQRAREIGLLGAREA